MSPRRPYMTRDDWQHCQQDLARYRRNMAEALGRLPLWANDHERERWRQLRLRKPQALDLCYPETLITPKAQQEGANR